MDQTPITATHKAIRQLSGVPTSFRLAGLALLSAAKGTITFKLPDGRSVKFEASETGAQAMVDIHDFGFAQRGLAGGDVGFAEAYMDGQWSTPDLTSVLRYFEIGRAHV